MKLFTILSFTVLLVIVSSQSLDSEVPTSGSTAGGDGSEAGYDFSALSPLVKGILDGFRMLMLQVRMARSLFENLGLELGRIARNTTAIPGGLLPPPRKHYGFFGREEPSTGESMPGESTPTTVPEAGVAQRIASIFEQWGQNTAVALRNLVTEVAYVYQDAVATMIKQGEVSRNQVMASYNTIRQAMNSVASTLNETFPAVSNLGSSIQQVGSSIGQNITTFLSEYIPTMPSLPNLDLIPTTTTIQPPESMESSSGQPRRRFINY